MFSDGQGEQILNNRNFIIQYITKQQPQIRQNQQIQLEQTILDQIWFDCHRSNKFLAFLQYYVEQYQQQQHCTSKEEIVCLINAKLRQVKEQEPTKLLDQFQRFLFKQFTQVFTKLPPMQYVQGVMCHFEITLLIFTEIHAIGREYFIQFAIPEQIMYEQLLAYCQDILLRLHSNFDYQMQENRLQTISFQSKYLHKWKFNPWNLLKVTQNFFLNLDISLDYIMLFYQLLLTHNSYVVMLLSVEIIDYLLCEQQSSDPEEVNISQIIESRMTQHPVSDIESVIISKIQDIYKSAD